MVLRRFGFIRYVSQHEGSDQCEVIGKLTSPCFKQTEVEILANGTVSKKETIITGIMTQQSTNPFHGMRIFFASCELAP